MKNITAVGYLTKDCEVVESEKSSFVKLSIAVDDVYGDNKGTIIFGARYFRTNIYILSFYKLLIFQFFLYVLNIFFFFISIKIFLQYRLV